MPGYFIVRPIEANLTHDTELVGKMSPYCTFQIGRQKMRGQVCSKGGKHPHWNDTITLPATQPKVTVEVMDKDIVTHDDKIGTFTLDLGEVQAAGQVSRWYPLSYKDRSAGEILLDVVYQPGTSVRQGSYNNNSSSYLSGQNQSYYQGQQYANTSMAGAGMVGAGMVGVNVLGSGSPDQSYYQGQQQQQYASTGMIGGQSQYQGQYYSQQGSQYYKQQEQVKTQTQAQTSATAQHNVWTEQVQVVTPHVFMKEIDVVETRPVLKEVEIMEPRKVLREVQYTQAVPVKKQIEVTKPEVVMKEIEVMEPRVITKTIQVVENVTVSRPVQVIEMKNSVQEVETMEPQTFHKPIEVTEYVPVKKQIEVTQPITLKKAVEFVEPVITTQTITKEEFEPVIVNQEVVTTVGPASVVAMSTEYGYIKQFGDLSLTETKHLGALKRWVGYETIFGGLTDEERLWEQQRLNRLSEQDWILERERLMKLNEQERLLQQRSFFQKLRDRFSKKPTTTTTFQYRNRWQGLDNWFTGLNDKERIFAQDRINRFSEPEWVVEKERLMMLSDQDRMLEQRCLYMKAINDGYEFGPTTTYSVSPNIQISQPL